MNWSFIRTKLSSKYIRLSILAGFIIILTIFLANPNVKLFIKGSAVSSPAVILSNPQKLLKRSRWDWVTYSAVFGCVIAAGTTIRPDLVASVCLLFTGGVCAPVAGLIVSVVTVGVAAYAASKAAGSATKRGGSFVKALMGQTLLFDPWLHQNGTIELGGEAGTLVFHHKVQVTSDSKKRYRTTSGNGVVFSSNLGNHIALSYIHSPEELSNLIVSAQPGVPNYNNYTYAKRDGYPTDGFEVSWLSYNYDNGNSDLCSVWENNEPTDEGLSYFEGQVQNWIAANRDWKYCFAAVDAKAGEVINYDDISGVGSGTGNALHGEIYFNTYGGIDGFCNDNHDGAQGDR
ncbi:hypothetical protein TPHA_0P01860 [Tetrapisispora phaffii CBS 4417]|uniref:Uncharacterized protein n=1 Tax=Tetrapisispora phaffii (strain ATCC 24235 / CBS 4417 / NBRC 1672 / NRRL Y-8282 / UCD 70-5) TaxID=1071381 RepID=G8C2G5_TETPH|nr:hypothetical protein TPHA_0P01860 [Tetrapisispora phaffii CBS 4417]CCE66343.1 hypothetical protein TPHA_0P01860 [Tetrapisispora phaffii CBS 4417]